MLFTRKLIKKFIPEFDKVTDEQLTVAVNSLGMEIESVFKYSDVNNIVVGKLLKAEKVEGTHLSKCEVETGKDVVQHIVCGASNLQVGKYVLVAQVGAKLPNGITIAKRQIKGMESNGMMCAYSELAGIDTFVADAEKDEIIMLDNAEVGSTQWKELIGLDDTIYDITVPANRNDENCYLVFCFEVANKLNLKFIVDFDALLPRSRLNEKHDIKLDEKTCSFLSFTDVTLTGENKTRSSWDLKSALMNSGVKPINALLDRLAYVTLLTNCPTHVYDADKLKGKMTCKLAPKGFKFNALNGKTYELTKDDIVICDETGPVSIACVIGSEATKVTDATKIARIEVGNFQFANVRNTSIRLNLATEASHRASRGYSNYLNMLAVLLAKIYFDNSLQDQVYFKPNWLLEPIEFSYDTLKIFINEPIEDKFVVESLKKLGFKSNLMKTKFYAPRWRTDVFSQEDIYEEILKIIDINNLKPIEIEDKLLPLANNTEYDLRQELKNILLNNGISEVKTYNLTNKDNLNKFNLFGIKDHIKIQCNNANREYFRSSLIDNMLKVYQYNAARKLDLMAIFEIQKLFSDSKKWTNLTVLTLDKYEWDSVTDSYLTISVNMLKGICNSLAHVLNTKFNYKSVESEYFYSNECVAIYWKNEIIGYIGKIKNSLLKGYDLANKNIYCFSLNIDKPIAQYKKPDFKVRTFGQFQQLSKDVNIVLNKNNKAEIEEKIKKIRTHKFVLSTRIIKVFNKEDSIVYTVRYYLVDTKQFTTSDIAAISKEIEELVK